MKTRQGAEVDKVKGLESRPDSQPEAGKGNEEPINDHSSSEGDEPKIAKDQSAKEEMEDMGWEEYFDFLSFLCEGVHSV